MKKKLGLMLAVLVALQAPAIWAAGAPAYTVTIPNPLPVASGGTGISAFGTGVATALGVNTGSAGAVVVNGGAGGTPSSLTLTNATGLPVAGGGTGLSSGTSGGIPYFSASNAMTSSAALTQYFLIVGGGAGATPVSLGDNGSTSKVLHGNGAGAPTFSVLNVATEVTGVMAATNGGTGLSALGTGVATALGVNVGSAGAPVLFNGAGGTPSSLTLTNATALPILTGLAGVAVSVLGADTTTTNLTATNIGISFSIAANETWIFDAYLNIGSSSAAGTKYAIDVPASATLLGQCFGTTSTGALFTTDELAADATLGAQAWNTAGITTAANPSAILHIHGVIVNSVNAGTVQLMHAKVTSGTSSVYANSYATARRAN